MLRPLELAHHLLAEIIVKGDVVVDATMGQGLIQFSWLVCLTLLLPLMYGI
jgi:hypothetical protein